MNPTKCDLSQVQDLCFCGWAGERVWGRGRGVLEGGGGGGGGGVEGMGWCGCNCSIRQIS